MESMSEKRTVINGLKPYLHSYDEAGDPRIMPRSQIEYLAKLYKELRPKLKKHRLPRKEKKRLVKGYCLSKSGRKHARSLIRIAQDAGAVKRLLELSRNRYSSLTYFQKEPILPLDYLKKISGSVALTAMEPGKLLVNFKNGLPPSDFNSIN